MRSRLTHGLWSELMTETSEMTNSELELDSPLMMLIRLRSIVGDQRQRALGGRGQLDCSVQVNSGVITATTPSLICPSTLPPTGRRHPVGIGSVLVRPGERRDQGTGGCTRGRTHLGRRAESRPRLGAVGTSLARSVLLRSRPCVDFGADRPDLLVVPARVDRGPGNLFCWVVLVVGDPPADLEPARGASFRLLRWCGDPVGAAGDVARGVLHCRLQCLRPGIGFPYPRPVQRFGELSSSR